jgi:hypothetical protein
MRLLRCWDCKSVEEIPGEGPVEESDPLLRYLLEKHRGPISEARIQEARFHGVRFNPRSILPEEEHLGDIGVVADDKWGKFYKEILKEMWKNETGIDSEFYASKNTFQADAMACFNRHSRPADGCIDWLDDSKRITPKDWEKGRAIHLCLFCPVSSTVMTAQRKAKGYYDKLPGEMDLPL